MSLSLMVGQRLYFSGAYVNANGFWILTIAALGGDGSVLTSTPLPGQGSQSGLSYYLGPFNTPGTAYSFQVIPLRRNPGIQWPGGSVPQDWPVEDLL